MFNFFTQNNRAFYTLSADQLPDFCRKLPILHRPDCQNKREDKYQYKN